MHITIAPASTKTGAATISALLQDPSQPEVSGIYRDLKKVPSQFTSHPRFKAVQGDISDPSSLDFAGSDAVLAITPPAFDGRDLATHADDVSKNVREAIERAGSVKRLVYLSSVGAQNSSMVGEIKTNHIAEQVFSQLSVSDLTFVRCAYFMENWAMALASLKGPKPALISTITPADRSIPMVAAKDIGTTLAKELLSAPGNSTSRPNVFELQGPRSYSPEEVRACFEQAMNASVELQLIQPRELHEFYSKIFPASIVPDWVEMAESLLPGGIMDQDEGAERSYGLVRGTTGLNEAIAGIVEEYM